MRYIYLTVLTLSSLSLVAQQKITNRFNDEIKKIEKNTRINLQGKMPDACLSDSSLIYGWIILRKRNNNKTEINFYSNNPSFNTSFNAYTNFPLEVNWSNIYIQHDSTLIARKFIAGCPKKRQFSFQDIERLDKLFSDQIKPYRDQIIILETVFEQVEPSTSYVRTK